MRTCSFSIGPLIQWNPHQFCAFCSTIFLRYLQMLYTTVVVCFRVQTCYMRICLILSLGGSRAHRGEHRHCDHGNANATQSGPFGSPIPSLFQPEDTRIGCLARQPKSSRRAPQDTGMLQVYRGSIPSGNSSTEKPGNTIKMGASRDGGSSSRWPAKQPTTVVKPPSALPDNQTNSPIVGRTSLFRAPLHETVCFLALF